MVNQIYINLPVKNLKKSMEFFKQLGFSFNSEFTNEHGACLILGENIYSMLLTTEFFKTFTKKNVIDPQKDIQVITAISLPTRKEVDSLIEKAIAAGGKALHNEALDHGFMYYNAFEDIDGNVWEPLSYEPKKK